MLHTGFIRHLGRILAFSIFLLHACTLMAVLFLFCLLDILIFAILIVVYFVLNYMYP